MNEGTKAFDVGVNGTDGISTTIGWHAVYAKPEVGDAVVVTCQIAFWAAVGSAVCGVIADDDGALIRADRVDDFAGYLEPQADERELEHAARALVRRYLNALLSSAEAPCADCGSPPSMHTHDCSTRE